VVYFATSVSRLYSFELEDGVWLMNLAWIWKEIVVSLIEILSRNLPGGTEKKKEKFNEIRT
jgi:hypothetical protein